MIPKGHFIFLDLETTGTKASIDRITEIGFIEVLDGEVIDRFESLINPEMSIPPFISQLTGISNEMVNAAPTFSDMAETLLEQLSNKVLVAHNASV